MNEVTEDSSTFFDRNTPACSLALTRYLEATFANPSSSELAAPNAPHSAWKGASVRWVAATVGAGLLLLLTVIVTRAARTKRVTARPDDHERRALL